MLFDNLFYITLEKDGIRSETLVIDFDDQKGVYNEIIKRKVINIKSHREVALVLYNSLTRSRNEVLFKTFSFTFEFVF
jgi:hypothetical protein